MTYLTVPFFTYIFAVLPVWLPLLLVDLASLYLLLFKERFDPRTLIFWVTVVFILPFVGTALYLIVGSTILMDSIGRRKEEDDRAFLEGESDEVPHEFVPLDSVLRGTGSDVYTSGNDVDVVWNMDREVDSHISSIEAAERTIHIEANRLSGWKGADRVVDALCRKAREGVDVRIITSVIGFGRTKGMRRLRAAGVSHCTFHGRLRSLLSLRPANRCFREICVIDGIKAYIGSGSFLLVKGAAAVRAERRFLADWFHAAGERLSPPDVHVVDEGGCGVQLVSSGPDSPGLPMLHGYSMMISEARDRLYMSFPYLIPNDETYNSIKQAVIAGTDVRILIPVKCRHWYQAWNSLAALNPLMCAGAKVYFARKTMVKSVVVADGVLCTVGSCVYNSRSVRNDYGENAVVYSESVSRSMEEEFLRELDDAVECRSEEYMNRSFWDRIKIGIARMLMFLNRCRSRFVQIVLYHSCVSAL